MYPKQRSWEVTDHSTVCMGVYLLCAGTVIGAGGTPINISQDRYDSALMEFLSGR